MPKKRMSARLYPWFLAVILAPLALVVLATWKAVENFQDEQTRSDLLARVELFRAGVEPLALAGGPGVDRFCKSVRGGVRFTVIGPDGTVLGDTDEDPARMANHGGRAEVRDALAGRRGVNEHFSDTLRKPQIYIAVPLLKNGSAAAVIRGSVTVSRVKEIAMKVIFRIVVIGLMAAGVSAAVGLYASRLAAEPLEEMEKSARRFAEGDLTARVPVPDSLELANLAETLNRMARLLDERIGTEIRQGREREAVLASMDEGVLALDGERRIIGVNAAAARLLQIDPVAARGRFVLEMVRQPGLERFTQAALHSDGGLEGDLVLRNGEEVHLQLRGAPLRDEAGRRMGVVIVLNDVTRLRRLERVRREFVANASHELRTPITAIRGFAETLTEGAADDPEAARRFAGIIETHARRLEALVADMLTLSRLEHLSEGEKLALERAPVGRVLQAAAAACDARADARKISLMVSCPPELDAFMAPSLMEQAVINLLDNAIKYSDEGGAVSLLAQVDGDRVAIRVCDGGCGIERQHLTRLFERFYRVDNARSRKLGGTGLGLAIVKHILLAHGGEVDVQSTPGEGSEFILRFPRERGASPVG
ncbi:MAG: ATP-binding protein [Kiritimatiellia bacterium]